MASEDILKVITRVRRKGGFTHVEKDGELVVVSHSTGKSISLNQTAREIWEQIERPRSIVSLVRHLCAKYEVEPKACETDVIELIDQLEKLQLIENDAGNV